MAILASRGAHVAAGGRPLNRLAVVVSLLLGGAAALRLVAVSAHPGYEWDEPVYTSVARHLATEGVLQAKTEYRTTPEPYLYHPPFYFYLLAGWFRLFGAGIGQARLLAVLGSIGLLALLIVLLRRAIGAWGLAVVGLLSIDAWLVFTNRVSWIENTMMPLGVAALLVYYQALQRQHTRLFVLAGVLLGAVTVYKHVGVYFFLAVLLCWLIVRRSHREHVALVGGFAAVMAAYILAMAVFFNTNFVQQVRVQVARSLGTQESRGALGSIEDIIGPLTAQYAIYWVSLLLAGVSAVCVVGRLIWVARRRGQLEIGETVLLAWATAALLFFAVLQLKIPHYFLMIQVPLFSYLGVELRRFFRNRSVSLRAIWAVAAVVGLVIGANVMALTLRLGWLDGNPLQETATWTAAHLPPDATVVTEESVGTIISQPYCKLAFARFCTEAEYVITYTSATQRVPDTRSVESLLEGATELARFEGFKEVITVYETVS